MDEKETPVFHISGTLSEKDFKTAVRGMGFRAFLRYALIFLGFIILLYFLMELYQWSKSEWNQYYSFGEWLKFSLEGIIERPLFLIIEVALIAFYALLFLVIRPNLAAKQMRESSPDGLLITYDFYENQLVCITKSRMIDQTAQIKYADVQRKIAESKYYITLTTTQRHKATIYKALTTPEEAERVSAFLKERCPQRKA